LCENLEIFHFFSRNTETKAPFVERVIRTIKEKIYKYLTYNNTNRYIDILNDVINNYNYSIHSRTKFAPVDVNKENSREVFNNFFKNRNFTPKKSILSVKDLVRISKLKKAFEKGFFPNWSEELFKITRVINSIPRKRYNISDLKGNKIIGSFYDRELQKVLEK
jgi:hypothetical protein